MTVALIGRLVISRHNNPEQVSLGFVCCFVVHTGRTDCGRKFSQFKVCKGDLNPSGHRGSSSEVSVVLTLQSFRFELVDIPHLMVESTIELSWILCLVGYDMAPMLGLSMFVRKGDTYI